MKLESLLLAVYSQTPNPKPQTPNPDGLHLFKIKDKIIMFIYKIVIALQIILSVAPSQVVYFWRFRAKLTEGKDNSEKVFNVCGEVMSADLSNKNAYAGKMIMEVLKDKEFLYLDRENDDHKMALKMFENWVDISEGFFRFTTRNDQSTYFSAQTGIPLKVNGTPLATVRAIDEVYFMTRFEKQDATSWTSVPKVSYAGYEYRVNSEETFGENDIGDATFATWECAEFPRLEYLVI